jgi:DNA-binding CsgD family transcriptional regulator
MDGTSPELEETVSGRSTRACLRTMRAEGIDLARAVVGTSLLPSHADAPPARVSWREHALLTDRFAEALGGVYALEAVFEREQRGAMPLLSLVAGSVIDPVELYRLMDKMLAPSLFPMFEIHFAVRGDGSVDAAGYLPEPYAPSLAFMHAMVGLHRGAPRMLGLPSSVVEAETTGRSVRMRIVPPARERSVLGRVVSMGHDVLDEFAVLNQELASAFAVMRANAGEAAKRGGDDAKREGLAERLAERSAAWGLTARQREVLAGVAEGLTNKELCERLGCSLPTVETHMSALLRKAGAMSRGELMAALWRGGRGSRRV